ncbi:MAG: protein kinase, partial [Anaerotignum sp.]
MLLNPGTVLSGRYEILEKIGSGGMAVVYRGRDRKLDRYVTVKVLREEFIGDEEFIERFRSEACSAARLSHPNIVRAYDVGEDGDINYIVNEYIHGDTLKKAIKEKAPFDSRSTINVAIQIASALSQAHKAHIVHRDIKPQNILVGTDGVVKVTDFGIARAATASTMTTTANAAGSVHYFSPEQARGGYVDEKSDIYSLGITMFEMITGVLPFQGNNSVTIALKHINDELPDIRQYNPNCTPSLEGIIKKATMKKADERYASIDLLLADLIRARAEITGAAKTGEEAQEGEKKEAAGVKGAAVGAAAGAAGVRMSRRAEAAARLREAQEKAEAEKAAQAAVETPQETKPADPKELEYIRRHKAEPVEEVQEEKVAEKEPAEEEGDIHT